MAASWETEKNCIDLTSNPHWQIHEQNCPVYCTRASRAVKFTAENSLDRTKFGNDTKLLFEVFDMFGLSRYMLYENHEGSEQDIHGLGLSG